MRARLAVVCVVAMVAAAALARPAASGQATPSDTVRLLEVPYVPQSEALCGGAALAMVLRYWGEPAVLAEDFSDLLTPGAAGIRTGALVDAVTARGWSARPMAGTPAVIQRHLTAGRPVVALIGAGSGSASPHYVVLVAWANGGIILHDPAVGPHRVRREPDFLASWARSGNWALLVLPPDSTTAPLLADHAAADTASIMADEGCKAIVAAGIRLARAGDIEAAESRFLVAAALCPTDAAPFRERAGLAFGADDWPGAADLAERSLALDPDDAHTWQLLAASRYLGGDTGGALRAWNRIAEPRTDLMRVEGLARMRFRVVSNQLDLPPGRLLTARAFRRAERRLDELPVPTDSRLSVQPLAGGIARVNVAVVERPLLVDGAWDAGGQAVRALVEEDVGLNLASPTGNGELWRAAYRWSTERPRLSVDLAVPAAGGRPGIWRVSGLWDRQAYADPKSGAPVDSADARPIRERRRRAALSFSDWVGPDVRLELQAARDAWRDRGSYLSIGASLESRWARDRLALRAAGFGWAGARHARPFQAGGISADWRPASRHGGGWSARVGIESVSSNAPLAVWPGAGTGTGRAPLLRAHPLLNDGVLDGRAFGRTLLHGGLERQAWPWTIGPLRAGWVVFIDAARPWRPVASERVPWLVDAGAGLRLSGMGNAGRLRLDAARSVDGGAWVASIGWEGAITR